MFDMLYGERRILLLQLTILAAMTCTFANLRFRRFVHERYAVGFIVELYHSQLILTSKKPRRVNYGD